MEVALNVKMTGNIQYVFEFKFEYNLYSIDFEMYPINHLLRLHLSNIPADKYTLANPRIEDNILSVDLIPL
jgi:hypothetical protein